MHRSSVSVSTVFTLVLSCLELESSGHPITAENSTDAEKFPASILKRMSADVEIKLRDVSKLSTQFESLAKYVQEKNSHTNDLYSSIEQAKLDLIKELESKIEKQYQETQVEVNQRNLAFYEELKSRIQKQHEEIQDLVNQTNLVFFKNIESKIQEQQTEFQTESNRRNQALETKVKKMETDILALKSTNNQNSATVLDDLKEIKKAVTALQSETKEINTLKAKVESLESLNSSNKSGSFKIPNMKGVYKKPVVDLYYRANHDGRTERIDFKKCPETTSCCQNLVSLSENSESINTLDSCVVLYYEKDCGEGVHGIYYPGTPHHMDFGSDKNKYQSIGTCY